MTPIMIVLAASVLVNAILGWQWLDARDDLAAANEKVTQVTAVADQCSKETARLESDARKSAKLAASERAKAKASADAKRSKADKILLTPPTVPGNDCKSASERAANWLTERKP